MFNNSSKIMFLSIMIISALISVSSNTWMGVWMGLEINLLSFIPLMSDSNNLLSSESSLKYFLTQALASSVLLFAATLMITEDMWMAPSLLGSPSLVISSSLLMKMGAAPFHFWFPLVAEGLTWTNLILLMTWQKLAPLMMISYFSNWVLFLSIIFSAVVGSVGGLNQASMRKLMTYSSINHMSWMIASQMLSEMLWINYFLFYCLLAISVSFLFSIFNIISISQLFSSSFSSIPMKVALSSNLLSLGGLPPFIGFYPKWSSIQVLTENSQLLIVVILVMCSLVTLFFYLRLCFSSFTIGYSEMNWSMLSQKLSLPHLFCLVLSFISIVGLPSISLSYLMV